MHFSSPSNHLFDSFENLPKMQDQTSIQEKISPRYASATTIVAEIAFVLPNIQAIIFACGTFIIYMVITSIPVNS
jgi:hypothetical protein